MRADTLPLVFPVLGADGLPRGTQLRVRLGEPDEIALDLRGTVIERLDGQTTALDDDSEDDGELAAPLAIALDVEEAEAPAALDAAAESAPDAGEAGR